MIVNTILYIYLFLCVMILLYTLSYILYSAYRNYKEKRAVMGWQVAMANQIYQVNLGKGVHRDFIKKLQKELVDTEELKYFEKALESFQEEEVLLRILCDLQKVILYLAKEYGDKGTMDKAYFALFYSRFSKGAWTDDQFLYIFLGYLDQRSIYVRDSVLKAVISAGQMSWVLRVLTEFTDKNWSHHAKLVGDSLTLYPGDHEELTKVLWQQWRRFLPTLRQGVLLYTTQKSSSYKREMYEVMTDERENIELRLSAMRYFMKNLYEHAEEVLRQYVLDPKKGYEIRVVAARVLGKYESKETLEVLKESLGDPNWYVRFNASEALIEQKRSLIDMKDILLGEDVYAKEILEYRITERSQRK